MCVRTAAARKKRTADPASARRPLSESPSFAIYFGRHTRRRRLSRVDATLERVNRSRRGQQHRVVISVVLGLPGRLRRLGGQYGCTLSAPTR